MTGVVKIFKKLWCSFLGHRYVKFDQGLKRKCSCGNEQWLFSNPYPKIGEAKYFWKDTNFW